MWEPRVRTALVIAGVAAFTAAVVADGSVGATGRSVTASLPRPLELGAIRTVDENDVGDPFILTVPPGVDPPGGLPYTNRGPDAYVSAPWTADDASSAARNGWYVLFGTTDWQSNVPTAVSLDGFHWTQAPDALPVLPVWAEPSISMTWAPAALHLGGRWVLFFSTEEGASGLECIGRAISTRPAGPYVDDSSRPMLCQPAMGGSIDPSVIGQGGVHYLLWKNDGNSSGKPDYLWSQALSPDGLSLTGVPHRLLGAGPPWTQGIVEAPAMIASSGGGYWLFYSGGDWDSGRYGTGLARCSTVYGPCSGVPGGPFLATSRGLVSPGGVETFTRPGGGLWAAFTSLVRVPSTWDPGLYYYNRVLDIAPILTR